MTDEKNAESKEILDDTQNTLAMDTKFLADLKDRCANMDAEFAERTKARQAEIEAVSKAFEFLSSDEAHDLFTRTFNPAFLQTAAVSRTRNALSKLLKNVAAKEKDDDVKHKDYCIDEFNANEVDTANKNREK